jgi:hypothetical protein
MPILVSASVANSFAAPLRGMIIFLPAGLAPDSSSSTKPAEENFSGMSLTLIPRSSRLWRVLGPTAMTAVDSSAEMISLLLASSNRTLTACELMNAQ